MRKGTARLVALFVCCGAVVGLLGCASSSPPEPPPVAVDPFRGPDAKLGASVRRLCLRPISSELPMKEGEERLTAFEERIARRLERAGFEVVGSEATGKAAEGGDDAPGAGDAFDRDTGRAIPGKAVERAAQVRARQVAQLHCDAFVSAELAIVQAFWDDRLVVWDGREVWADGRNGTHQVGIALRDAYIGGVRGWGSIPALSLHLAIRDPADRVIFWNAAGIQPVATLRSVPYQIRWDPLPDDRILGDPESNQTAVDLAVGPLDPKTSIERAE